MVFSDEDKAVIKNDYQEKDWSAGRICKEHPSKKWHRTSVQNLINRFKAFGTMERRPGSGRPRTVTTPENEALISELICSQEDKPGTHLSPREIEKCTVIKRSSVVRMVKKNGYQQYKRLKTPRVTAATKQRRAERATALAEKFGKSKRSIERCVWQDEKDFTLEVLFNSQNSRVYCKGKKADVPDANLFHQKIGKAEK